jgi:hypothetical protein
MTNLLSPAADAVLDAYMNNCGWLDGPFEKDYRCAAAVLRAAADQVVPETTTPWNSTLFLILSTPEVRAKFLAIADELEANAQ